MSLDDSLDRFLAYFSGSWGTFFLYEKEGWDTPYPGLTVLYPGYKILSFGSIDLKEFVRFYDVSGFQLNVVPFFQLAYLEGGLILQLVVVIFTAFIYSLFRYLARIYSNNIFIKVAFLYFCSVFVISSLFSSIFLDLQFYTTMFLLIFFSCISGLLKKTVCL